MSERKGSLIDYFETGMEGADWAFCEENKGWDGMHFLKGKHHIMIARKEDSHIVFMGVVNFLGLREAKRHSYFKQYVKTVTYETGYTRTQLNLGGMWIHHIPDGIDLVLFWNVTQNEKDYVTTLLENDK